MTCHQCQDQEGVRMTAVTRDHDHDHGNLETITSGSVMTTGTWRLSYRLETESDIWRTETMLSEHIWDLQQQNINFVINWKIIEKTSGFNPITLQCKICLSEIYHIVVNSDQASLNRRLETFSYCRHLKKYLLSKAQYFYTKGGALLMKSGR